MLLVSKMTNVYHSSCGEFIFPGSNAFNDELGKKVTSAKDIIEMIELGLINKVETVSIETAVETNDSDAIDVKGAKAIASMDDKSALKAISECIHLAVLNKVKDFESRAHISAAATKKFDEIMKAGSEETF